MSWHNPSISTSEAVSLTDKLVTLDEIQWSKKMWDDYIALHGMTGDYTWDMACIISTAFVAGMTQGIRDERAKAKAKEAKMPNLLRYTIEHLHHLSERNLRIIYRMTINLK